MGNRLEENCCIKCGDPLLELNPNSWHMCTGCTERTKKLVHDIRSNKTDVGRKPHKIFIGKR